MVRQKLFTKIEKKKNGSKNVMIAISIYLSTMRLLTITVAGLQCCTCVRAIPDMRTGQENNS